MDGVEALDGLSFASMRIFVYFLEVSMDQITIYISFRLCGELAIAFGEKCE